MSASGGEVQDSGGSGRTRRAVLTALGLAGAGAAPLALMRAEAAQAAPADTGSPQTWTAEQTFEAGLVSHRDASGDDPVWAIRVVSGVKVFMTSGGGGYEIPAGSPGLSVDRYGSVYAGPNELVPHGEPGDFSTAAIVPDFLYYAPARRIFARSLALTEVGDPVDLAIGRFGPNNTGYPVPTNGLAGLTAIPAGTALGSIYWRGAVPGATTANPQATFQTRSVSMGGRSAEDFATVKTTTSLAESKNWPFDSIRLSDASTLAPDAPPALRIGSYSFNYTSVNTDTDVVSGITAAGSPPPNGTGFNSGSAVSQTWYKTGAHFLLSVTPKNKSIPVERLRVESQGQVLIGRDAPLGSNIGQDPVPGGSLHVQDEIRCAGPIFAVNGGNSSQVALGAFGPSGEAALAFRAGSGAAPGSVVLYAANSVRIATSKLLQAGGLSTKAISGQASDGHFANDAPDGTIAVDRGGDPVEDRLAVRIRGQWKHAVLT
jgi:hypothetical protein